MAGIHITISEQVSARRVYFEALGTTWVALFVPSQNDVEVWISHQNEIYHRVCIVPERAVQDEEDVVFILANPEIWETIEDAAWDEDFSDEFDSAELEELRDERTVEADLGKNAKIKISFSGLKGAFKR